jgi:hypothetical protein
MNVVSSNVNFQNQHGPNQNYFVGASIFSRRRRNDAILFKYLFERQKMNLVFDNGYVYLYLF